MIHQALTLTDSQSGNLAFKVFPFTDTQHFDHLQRNNFFSLIWITKGSGRLKSDFSEYVFGPQTLLAFSPYQPFMILAPAIEGVAIHFHTDFFCIHKHRDEVACNGVLFNNIYQPPFVGVTEQAAQTFHLLLEQIALEMQQPALAHYELLVSYLKIFLITASRLKAGQHPETAEIRTESKEPFILQDLKDAIEANFKTHHSASNYADLLNMTSKALARLTKTHFNKTLTDLISERIIIEAKRELYLTNKPIKEIAYELGYNDEYYFSRFFKTNADVSPQLFRETVGSGRDSL